MDAPRRCPRCISDEVIRILYGTPTPDLLEQARAGRVALGAVMCFGPKRRSGCALHVSTSGANKRRNRDLSRKPHALPRREPLTQTPCYEKVCKMCHSADVPTLGVTYSSARGRAGPTLRTPSATRGSVGPPEHLPLPLPLARASLLLGLTPC